jgi:DNA-binding response OmpR family regulator
MVKVLVVEDDGNIRSLVSKYLEREGYEVHQAADGLEGLDLYEKQHYDILITDVMMPKTDGNELTATIRRNNRDIPILMLTALESIDDKEKGFLSGSDDYMVKPVDMKELVLRVKALLRRYRIATENQITHKKLHMDAKLMVLTIDEKAIDLTQKEFSLLFKLVSNPNRIYTRNQLMNEIWGYDSESFDRTVDTHIKRLREKIISDDIEIITVRGLGYKVVLV